MLNNSLNVLIYLIHLIVHNKMRIFTVQRLQDQINMSFQTNLKTQGVKAYNIRHHLSNMWSNRISPTHLIIIQCLVIVKSLLTSQSLKTSFEVTQSSHKHPYAHVASKA